MIDIIKKLGRVVEELTELALKVGTLISIIKYLILTQF